MIKKWLARVGLSIDDAAAMTAISNKEFVGWTICEAAVSDCSWSALSSFFMLHAERSVDVAVLIDGKGVHPLEIVTRSCYLDHIVARDGRSGVVSLYEQDDQVPEAGAHYQLFDAGVNTVALAKMESWAVERRTCGDAQKLQAVEIERHLMRRVLYKNLRQSFVKTMLAIAAEHRNSE